MNLVMRECKNREGWKGWNGWNGWNGLYNTGREDYKPIPLQTRHGDVEGEQ